MQQAEDFFQESLVLGEALDDVLPLGLQTPTGFKGWTVETIVRHLHFWNQMALWALEDAEALSKNIEPIVVGMGAGKTLPTMEQEQIPLAGRELLQAWRDMTEVLHEAYRKADPSQRCAWVGPSMSARSCITARQMETWAHGQAIFDELGREREETDRLQNIVILGVNTYDWTYQCRGETPPSPKPYVELIAPSGALWHYGEPQEANRVTGNAVDFARVVTQTRNVADTALQVLGGPADSWMRNAQCFAGGPNPPPEPGSRFTKKAMQ